VNMFQNNLANEKVFASLRASDFRATLHHHRKSHSTRFLCHLLLDSHNTNVSAIDRTKLNMLKMVKSSVSVPVSILTS
jgi:hypothetical protein